MHMQAWGVLPVLHAQQRGTVLPLECLGLNGSLAVPANNKDMYVLNITTDAKAATARCRELATSLTLAWLWMLKLKALCASSPSSLGADTSSLSSACKPVSSISTEGLITLRT